MIFSCGLVHNFSGLLFPSDEKIVSGFEIDRGVNDVAQGLCFHLGGGLEHGECGAETEGGRGVGIIENLVEDLNGFGCAFDGLLMPEQSLFAYGEFHFPGEGGNGSAPIGDCVPVNAGLAGGACDGFPFDEEGEDEMLRRGEGGIRGVTGEFGEWGW